ncbi:MAG: hypothetical protein A2Y17_00760 [Clostridiales bacterium GWF2_38_85]|nr:MAG: hypothetical protein A2Y17_00760 [Clostridiales bacterium GWF2_38_85]
MDRVEKLNKSIAYIEENLNSSINYNELCRICCCSLPTFQQLFSLTCGIPVSEYIRNRRMSVAAHELIYTDIKIIDLAMNLGYDSPEAFTRAYRSFHGIPPSVTRKIGAYEEYLRASIQIQVYGGKFKMGTKPIVLIETDNLIIRKFRPDDWKDLQEISLSNANSEFGDCDEQWPTDDNGIKGACDYFSNEHQFWAVEVKALKKVVCFINFNYIDENQSLNIGHVINLKYLGNNYEYEALKALYNYGFLELGALSISATWTLADNEKLAPLQKLGMKIVNTFNANKF